MIKTYSQFINESNNVPPGPGIEDVISISISDSEMNYVTDPIISSMISKGEISVIDNQLYYYDDDSTIQKLNQFFPEKVVNTLDEMDQKIGHVSNESKGK
jgi:hypothetical protein